MGKILSAVHNVWVVFVMVVLTISIALGFVIMGDTGRLATGTQVTDAPTSTTLMMAATPTLLNSTAPVTASVVPPYPAPGNFFPPSASAQPPMPRSSPTVVLPNLPSPLMPHSTYISKELVLARRGSGAGEIGLKESYGEALGPTSFTVDSAGNVYAIDAVNGRINKYDPLGAYVSSFAYDNKSIGAVDIAVWRDGSIFVADEATRLDSSAEGPYQAVHRFDPSGKVLLTYKWDGIYSITRVNVDSTGIVWAQGIDGTRMAVVQLGTVDGPFDRQRVFDSNKPGFAYRDGVFSGQLTTSADKKSGVSDVTLGDGRTVRLQLPMHPTNKEAVNAGSITIDTDASGNIYQDLGFFLPGDIPEIYVLVYDPSGKLTDQIQLPAISHYAPPRRSLYVDEQGRVYNMLTFQNGIKIIRWEKK